MKSAATSLSQTRPIGSDLAEESYGSVIHRTPSTVRQGQLGLDDMTVDL
jgi:hypothetical protein